MATTLKITVDYDLSNEKFSYTPSYTDASGTTYTALEVPEEDTIKFISGKYSGTLTDDSSPVPKTADPVFDAVHVVLGAILEGCAHHKSASNSDNFVLDHIMFPTLPSEANEVMVHYSWWQEHPTSSTTKFKDPKLGLSNSRGTTIGSIGS